MPVPVRSTGDDWTQSRAGGAGGGGVGGAGVWAKGSRRQVLRLWGRWTCQAIMPRAEGGLRLGWAGARVRNCAVQHGVPLWGRYAA